MAGSNSPEDGLQALDWSFVKVKPIEAGFELHVPDLETGRRIILALAPKFLPSTSSLEQRMKFSQLIEDWRLDSNQLTFSEREEQLGSGKEHIIDLFVINDDTEAEDKLKAVFPTILPKDFKIED